MYKTTELVLEFQGQMRALEAFAQQYALEHPDGRARLWTNWLYALAQNGQRLLRLIGVRPVDVDITGKLADEYIAMMEWSDTPQKVRDLVIDNVRGFAGFLADHFRHNEHCSQHPIWCEDDAGTPDRESLDSAMRRLFGREVTMRIKLLPEEDQGDAFVRRFPVEVVSSFPGATGIYALLPEPIPPTGEKEHGTES